MILYIIAICIGLMMDKPKNIALSCSALSAMAIFLVYYLLASRGIAQNPNTPVFKILATQGFNYAITIFGVAFITHFVRTRFFSA
jgi:hypothetical protein